MARAECSDDPNLMDEATYEENGYEFGLIDLMSENSFTCDVEYGEAPATRRAYTKHDKANTNSLVPTDQQKLD